MADRNTPYKDGELIPLSVAASTLIEAGKMAAKNATGYAVPAADAANLVVMGRAEDHIDNTAGADGALSVTVRRGKLFKFKNSATNAVTIADIGANVYVEDAETVSTSGGTNNIVAGKCMGVESDGVWVLID